MKQYLEIGKIVNTHGIGGEIKVQPWCDTPEFLTEFETLYFSDHTPLHILCAKVHKNCVLIRAKGIDTIEKATALRERILYMDRNDVTLPEDLVFIQDIIGLNVFDRRLDKTIGTLTEVIPNPANDVYVIRGEGQTYLVPAVKEFLKDIDLEKKLITISSIEGMYGDED